MSNIHPTAIVDPGAVLAADVAIGPYCVVGAGVQLDQGVRLHSHVAVAGRTHLGEGVTVYPFASVGHAPQDLKYRGEETALTVGPRTVIREHATLNPGTEGGGGLTSVGASCLIMVGAHVGHDCRIGDHVILVNNATCAGHVQIGDHAILGGLSAVHQFVRIGRHAMVGGMSGVEHDIIPFGLVTGNRAVLQGLNLVGLKRRGFSKPEISTLRAAYQELFAGEGTLQERAAAVAQKYVDSTLVQEVIAFVTADTSRSFCTPARG
ncbi:acyl-ACP--UDP-N-acetylglucosamine O-acyltransferase [Futiania mangrovi]|uniref:Acyl-[acyl-carrier-protein]--UDP-N-acetylglucosamine O-acyltransferase n=1 Tax=Futiania mangrovi TaxID=2959716 RepID=A0A9J6PC48_9PROT|nr:acyl-ACP--UDP-N-acetylglucosamine O-acyltransferase [Futiania mangrovii]MCP1335814.1 acyl-ACP--UDP-N-acetylglucosamine O-acyltransferase [Futiania mangrovii]